MTTRRRILPPLHLALAVALLAFPALAGGGGAPENDYRSAPLFFERYHDDPDWVGDEVEQLRRGYVRVERYDPVDATSFDWNPDSFTDYTWFMQMQDLRFLIPAITSRSDQDVQLAREWFMRWYAAFMVPKPDTSRWGEPISAGYRVMVLSLLLKVEEARAHPDADVVGFLKTTIQAHQKYLSGTEIYDALSNHGYILSLALYETTRVMPNPDARARALVRMRAMIDRTVSPAGIEKEHAVAYHYVVQVWLEQMTAYFRDLPHPPADVVDLLGKTFERMRRACYFLQDHDGRLAPIGDTDSVMVDKIAPAYRLRDPEGSATSVFDPASGYAIYKGDARTGDCRYVIFRIPDGSGILRRHIHCDALSVFFSHAGETILGEAGRYGYEASVEREYMLSARAHNEVLSELPGNEGTALHPAYDIKQQTAASGAEWSASSKLGGNAWTRVVRVGEEADAARIEDSLQPLSAAGSSAELVMIWNLGIDITDVTAEDAAPGKPYAWLLTTRKGQRIRLEIAAAGPGKSGILDVKTVRGQAEPLLGWYSPSRGVLHATTAIVLRLRRDPTLSVSTGVRVENGACGR